MSRSFRKTPIMGHGGATSEKEEKRFANRSLRRKVKANIRKEFDILPEMKEISDEWCFRKDGKGWFGDMKKGIATLHLTSEWLKKEYKKLMRK